MSLVAGKLTRLLLLFNYKIIIKRASLIVYLTAPSDTPLCGKFLALQADIRLGLKGYKPCCLLQTFVN